MSSLYNKVCQMSLVQKKISFVFVPFLILLVSLLLLNILSSIESDAMDTIWETRQLIIGLFVFTGFSFIPGFIQLSFFNSYPWFNVNLSHHSDSLRKHELRYQNSYFCVGCLGSSISILLANLLLILYFYFPSFYLTYNPTVLFGVGLFIILVAYSRYFTDFSTKIRLIQHTCLFLGLSILIIAEDILFQSALFNVLLLPSWLSFLLVRVKLSKIDHLDN
jgi:hypothetical protein